MRKLSHLLKEKKLQSMFWSEKHCNCEPANPFPNVSWNSIPTVLSCELGKIIPAVCCYCRLLDAYYSVKGSSWNFVPNLIIFSDVLNKGSILILKGEKKPRKNIILHDNMMKCWIPNNKKLLDDVTGRSAIDLSPLLLFWRWA